jgi:hypothetical protein
MPHPVRASRVDAARVPGPRPIGLLATLAAALAAAAIIAALAATSALATGGAGPPPVPLSVGSAAVGPPVAAGFVGLATEYWDVQKEAGTDPAHPDTAWEQIARNLSPYGGLTLRIGGDSTDWTWWPIAGMKQPPWVRWTMTPSWAAVTRRLVDDLHAHLIVGLNMEANNLRVDETEVHQIRTGVGPSVPITFELGNEPELYSHFNFYKDAAGQGVHGRPKDYSFSDITAQWNQMVNALPAARFAGPGYAGLKALPYVSGFLSASHRLSLLTVHTYPLKAARCTGSDHLQESQLFAPTSLQTMASALQSWVSVARGAGVGVRVDEMNSVTCGGEPGFTNSFGPALWALNILPLYAEAGAAGVNFQTRPYTAQNLIQTEDTGAGWRVAVQPEYYGLLAFARLTPPGTRLLQVSKMPAGLLAWAANTPQNQTHVVITNVNAAAASVALKAPSATSTATVQSLSDGSAGLRGLSGVTLAGQQISPVTGQLTGTVHTATVAATAGAFDLKVPPAAALIVTFKG